MHPSAIIDDGAIIGEGTNIWHFCHIMPGAKIGRKCNLGQNVFIADGVILGDGVKIQNNVSLYSGVICEDEVFIGPSAVFTNVKNPRSEVNRRGEYLQTLVKKGATIGANATILCGITLGNYCFIGAGAVVTKDVKDFELILGNPGKSKGWMSKMGNRLHFDEKGSTTCKQSGEVYKLDNGYVTQDEKS